MRLYKFLLTGLLALALLAGASGCAGGASGAAPDGLRSRPRAQAVTPAGDRTARAALESPLAESIYENDDGGAANSAPFPGMADMQPTVTAVTNFCKRPGSLASLTGDGCRAALSRLSQDISGQLYFESLEDCRGFLQKYLAEQGSTIAEHRAWCDRSFVNLHDRKGCYDAVPVFLGSFTEQGFCRQGRPALKSPDRSTPGSLPGNIPASTPRPAPRVDSRSAPLNYQGEQAPYIPNYKEAGQKFDKPKISNAAPVKKGAVTTRQPAPAKAVSGKAAPAGAVGTGTAASGASVGQAAPPLSGAAPALAPSPAPSAGQAASTGAPQSRPQGVAQPAPETAPVKINLPVAVPGASMAAPAAAPGGTPQSNAAPIEAPQSNAVSAGPAQSTALPSGSAQSSAVTGGPAQSTAAPGGVPQSAAAPALPGQAATGTAQAPAIDATPEASINFSLTAEPAEQLAPLLPEDVPAWPAAMDFSNAPALPGGQSLNATTGPNAVSPGAVPDGVLATGGGQNEALQSLPAQEAKPAVIPVVPVPGVSLEELPEPLIGSKEELVPLPPVPNIGRIVPPLMPGVPSDTAVYDNTLPEEEAAPPRPVAQPATSTIDAFSDIIPNFMPPPPPDPLASELKPLPVSGTPAGQAGT